MKQALISVSDKSGVADFARALSELGFSLLSTGGTAKTLREAGLEVRDVADVTGFPEMMDGRVKTLHPAVHGGLLARRDTAEHMEAIGSHNIAPIDLVCVNLYPFEKTVAREDVSDEEAIENIDIGGPSMLRSGAKNFASVTVVVDPNDYDRVLDQLKNGGDTTLELRRELATKVYSHTSNYDRAITNYLSKSNATRSEESAFAPTLDLQLEKAQDLRYGENPHQRGAFYREAHAPDGSLAAAKQVSGIALSFVNLFDLDGAWNLVCEFSQPAACIVKHANPCGCAQAETLADAFIKARDADPISRFGGIIAVNRVLDVATANEIIVKNSMYHAIIAVGYEPEALELLKNRSGWGADLRLLETGILPAKTSLGQDWKRVSGGVLVQDLDVRELNESELKVVTKRAPSETELADLLHAWKCVKHLKSNAIAIAKNGSLIGAGAGQMNRVSSVKLAIEQAGENALQSALASDAFFPFDDGPQAAATAGVTAIIQPGGSNRDADSIALCDRENIAMIFTNVRHFKH
jgi:phosphoribosylaminoimidazolecarboxamide formyltransferase/IMP cyclohydrolase